MNYTGHECRDVKTLSIGSCFALARRSRQSPAGMSGADLLAVSFQGKGNSLLTAEQYDEREGITDGDKNGLSQEEGCYTVYLRLRDERLMSR